MIRWQFGYAAAGFPQAAAPVAFALIAFRGPGGVSTGAAMILAMTITQILGAAPVTRLGRHLDPSTFFRILIAFRTLALSLVTALAWMRAPAISLIAAAALAGAVSGSAFGVQRLVLSQLVVPGRMARALGMAATVNEFTFVTAPVAVSLLGGWSPVAAMCLVVLVGASPILLMPGVPFVRAPWVPRSELPRISARTAALFLCAAATAAAGAAVEVGAVSLATRFGFTPAWAALFTTPLCIASAIGGVILSIRNRAVGHRTVVAFLILTTVGSLMIAAGWSAAIAIAGAALVGAFIAPLGTFLSLELEATAPAHRRAEVFAQLRAAGAMGVIFVSGLLAATTLDTTLVSTAVLSGLAVVVVWAMGRHQGRPVTLS